MSSDARNVRAQYYRTLNVAAARRQSLTLSRTSGGAGGGGVAVAVEWLQVALVGTMGAGKTTLAAKLLGREPATAASDAEVKDFSLSLILCLSRLHDLSKHRS